MHVVYWLYGHRTPFVWSSKAEQQLLSGILLPKLPYHPHDYQLEGICASLDGKDLLAVLPTGAEKTDLLFMHMLVVQRSLEELSLCPEKKYPKHAMILVVCQLSRVSNSALQRFRNCLRNRSDAAFL
jgi:hypothetical protein